LRGLRIELGEIEEILSSHPGVAQCVVVVRDFSDTDRRLVAYLVAAEGSKLDTGRLRDHLASKVPDYMVPVHFEQLSVLPTTPSGKIDRRALPEPQKSAAATEYVEPSNDVQRYVTDTWQSMLRTGRIGIRDNFFELGGDSLQAAIFCNLLSSIIDGYISVVSIFEHSTAEEFADFLMKEYPRAADSLAIASIDAAADRGHGRSDNIVPIPDRPRTIPVTEYQARTWLIDSAEERNPAYNTMIALELRGEVDIAALRNAIRRLVERHEILHTRYHLENGRLFQSICDLNEPPFAVAPLDAPLSEELIAHCVRKEARRLFDLEAGEVLRASLYCGTGGASLLIIDAHQIATDAWCRHLLLEEIAFLYRSETSKDATPHASSELQHGDFALWNLDRLSGPEGDRDRDFWKAFLSKSTYILDLPTDKLRPPVKTNNGATIRYTGSRRLSRCILELSGREHVSSFMVLMAGFFVLLAKYCDQKDIVVGSTVACREREETHKLMGRIANMIAVPARVEPDETFSELLVQVRDNLLGAFTHQEYPLTSVLRELTPPRDPSQTPLYQVVFAGETKPPDIPRVPGLDIRPVAVDKGLAKYDITMVVVENDDALIFDLEYNTDVFTDPSMKRLLNDYEALLEKLVDQPDLPMAAIHLEPATDRLSHAEERHWIDGFPIEVSRVREALRALAPVEQCDIHVQSEGDRDRLVAYYTGTETEPSQLQRMLAWRLPSFMLPAAYVYADDPSSLPAAKVAKDASPQGLGGKSGDRLEEQIIGQWRDLLGGIEMAPGDDFFRLGGSSILALEAVDRATRSFGVPITLRHFFEASTPFMLAEHVRVLRALTTPDEASREKQSFRI
jgi:hypothetical protein